MCIQASSVCETREGRVHQRHFVDVCNNRQARRACKRWHIFCWQRLSAVSEPLKVYWMQSISGCTSVMMLQLILDCGRQVLSNGLDIYANEQICTLRNVYVAIVEPFKVRKCSDLPENLRGFPFMQSDPSFIAFYLKTNFVEEKL